MILKLKVRFRYLYFVGSRHALTLRNTNTNYLKIPLIPFFTLFIALADKEGISSS